MEYVWLKSVGDISYPTFDSMNFKSRTAHTENSENFASYYFTGSTHPHEWTSPQYTTPAHNAFDTIDVGARGSGIGDYDPAWMPRSRGP